MDVDQLFSNYDPGDQHDKMKWDFPETKGFMAIYIDGYPYKVLKNQSSRDRHKVANTLHSLRQLTNKVCKDIEKYEPKTHNIDVFLDIHQETPPIRGVNLMKPFKRRGQQYRTHSNYLISQIPKTTGFEGLNKPKERYVTDQPFVGPDKNLRAEYRDVFLNLTPKTSINDIMDLWIHELAHTMANHVRYRPDDHHEDFQEAEKLLKKYFY